MEQEFHYWITGIVARHAGFPDEDAAIIAYAAQHVDDNDMLRTINDPQNPKKPYEAYISQTMDILKPKQELMRIYPIFHFLPGRYDSISAQRGDGKMHILTTTPDNDLANAVMREAVKSNDIYRIGVAAHSFADTWAHQNFVGWHDGINGQTLNPLPNIGHADFMHHPDWVGHRWDDSRVRQSSVNNNHRFLDAAKRLYEELDKAKKHSPGKGWPSLQKMLNAAMGAVYSGERIQGQEERLRAYQNLFGMDEYKPGLWFQEAVDTSVRGLPDKYLPSLTVFKDRYTWKDGWKGSHWYKFQEAVKAQQAYCMTALKPIFDQMGVDLRAH